MSHLTLETLARLVDEPPDPNQSAHLDACAGCAAELAALQGQTHALGELPRMLPAPDSWASVRDRLREEGLAATRVTAHAHPRGRWLSSGATRAAAAVLLFLGGGLTGWAARGPAAPAGPAVSTASTESTADGGAAVGPDGQTLEGAVPANMDDPQQAFLAALDQFMVAPPEGAGADPAARLAALDNIVLTTAQALHEAPADPLINSYHMVAQAQRQALVRQIQQNDPIF